MPVVNGTIENIEIVRANAVTEAQLAFVTFTVAGTYAQADNGTLTDIAEAIRDSRRDGQLPTILGAVFGQFAEKEAAPGTFMGLKTVAMSSQDVTFEITSSSTIGTYDASTELANGAVPTQRQPFGLYVSYIG